MNQPVAVAPVEQSHSELIRVYGQSVFRRACALSKTSPLSMEDLCKKLRELDQKANAPLQTSKALAAFIR